MGSSSLPGTSKKAVLRESQTFHSAAQGGLYPTKYVVGFGLTAPQLVGSWLKESATWDTAVNYLLRVQGRA